MASSGKIHSTRNSQLIHLIFLLSNDILFHESTWSGEESTVQRLGRWKLVNRKYKKYYIVAHDILPEALKRTAEAKEILIRGEAKTVNAAVEKIGLSKSAFYKYRDGIFAFHRAVHNKVVTLSFLLEHKTGVLSTILNTVAAEQGNILTINQGIPLQGLANATISIDTSEMQVSLETFFSSVGLIKGVHKVEVIGQS